MKALDNPRSLAAVFLLAMLVSILIPHAYSSTLALTVFTTKPSYLIADDITVCGNLTYNGSPVPSWPVAIEVQDPLGTPVVTRTAQTNTSGTHVLTFKLSTNARLGTYTVYVSSGYKGETAANSTAFLIGPVHNVDTRLSYMTIQAAIDASETLDGHTIFVDEGTYYEHVVLNKSLSLVGEHRSVTTIDGSGIGTVVTVSHDNINVSGFTIQNSGFPNAGIQLNNVNQCNLFLDSIENNWFNLILYSSSNNNMNENNIGNGYYGIKLHDSSNHNSISANSIAKNEWGIHLTNSINNTIYGNNIAENNWGIELQYSSNNSITGNNVTANMAHGIWLGRSPNNHISRNNITNNSDGVGLYESSNNTFHHNNFIDNTQQTYFLTSGYANFWDDGYPSGGNYWSDYAGVDFCSGSYQNESGGDGMGDTPYVIDVDNRDNYPLMNPWPSGWKLDFTAPTNHPIVDFAIYNGSLYAAADNKLYVKDGSSWKVIDAPTFVISLEPYENRLIVGGQNGLYYYDGTSFGLIFSVPTYIKVLGVYNDRLYAGTFLANPPELYYCNDSAENPANWHLDTDFATIRNFSGPFGSIDSFTVYSNAMYVGSGGTLYSFSGTDWSIATSYDDVYAFVDMQVYNGRLYLATRDQGWRKPMYLGGSGFSGRVIEFDGTSWTTVFDHDYWIFSLETYDNKLFVGTANKIYTYDGTNWNTSFSTGEGAYYAVSLITFNDKIYVGMGNGYIFADPVPETVTSPELPPTATVPEFQSATSLLFLMVSSLIAIVFSRRRIRRKVLLGIFRN